jgi:ribosomal protein S12 methylthiotransferase accessory factor YcaO
LRGPARGSIIFYLRHFAYTRRPGVIAILVNPMLNLFAYLLERFIGMITHPALDIASKASITEVFQKLIPQESIFVRDVHTLQPFYTSQQKH